MPGPRARPQILALGPFPPFVGGAAKNTAMICDALEARGAEVIRLSTNKTRGRAEHTRSFRFLAERSLGFLQNIQRMLKTGLDRGHTTVYLVPDGGFGVVFSVAYARIAASRYPRLVIHHRSYNHLRVRSRLMSLLMKTAPGKTIHIFLDPAMEQGYKALYSDAAESMFVPNAATCDITPKECEPQSTRTAPISIGFLSNLVEDKGFDVVADAFPKLAERIGTESRFLVAGRPVGERNEKRLEALKQRLGDQLIYFGEVSGRQKMEFFQRCDVFVFPTRFSQEAQPNVLYEAMAAGAAIVSTKWAGVPWVLTDTISRMIEADAGGNDALVEAVEDLIRSGELRTARTTQVKAFLDKKRDADWHYALLINELARPPLGGDGNV